MFKFSIRDLIWLTVVVALGLGWVLDHRARKAEQLNQKHTALAMGARAENLIYEFEKRGYHVHVHGSEVIVASHSDP